jgi:hypothetical protein
MLYNILLSRLILYAYEIIRITNVDFDVVGQRLIRYSVSFRHWTETGIIMVAYISYLSQVKDNGGPPGQTGAIPGGCSRRAALRRDQ